MAEDAGALRREQWAGFALDLTACLNRLLARQLADDASGFVLDVVDPSGHRVLRHALPAGAETWSSDVLARSALAGLQLSAIPRNAAEQLQSRRAGARNRALLVLALCLAAIGGAFFLVRAVAREAELAAMKVDLVSRVSHELRTPLSTIKMYGETLALGRAQNAEQTARFGAIVSREADRLTNLIARILDFSRQQAGRMEYRRTGCDLSALVRETTEQYRSHVEAAGGRLALTLDDGLRAAVDAGALAGALINLLENAVKYTPMASAERTVEVELRRAGDRAVLDVRDRGIGIPPGERTKVFASFYRASNAGEVRGAGIGLSLVQHFAAGHGAAVEALPRPGGGTIVRLSIPLLNAAPSP